MKNSNKKLGMYVGIALVVGAVGFIAYSKMTSKKLPVANTSTDEANNTPSKWSLKNPFSSNPANQINQILTLHPELNLNQLK
jgi:hypothetical protein